MAGTTSSACAGVVPKAKESVPNNRHWRLFSGGSRLFVSGGSGEAHGRMFLFSLGQARAFHAPALRHFLSHGPTAVRLDGKYKSEGFGWQDFGKTISPFGDYNTLGFEVFIPSEANQLVGVFESVKV